MNNGPAPALSSTTPVNTLFEIEKEFIETQTKHIVAIMELVSTFDNSPIEPLRPFIDALRVHLKYHKRFLDNLNKKTYKLDELENIILEIMKFEPICIVEHYHMTKFVLNKLNDKDKVALDDLSKKLKNRKELDFGSHAIYLVQRLPRIRLLSKGYLKEVNKLPEESQNSSAVAFMQKLDDLIEPCLNANNRKLGVYEAAVDEDTKSKTTSHVETFLKSGRQLIETEIQKDPLKTPRTSTPRPDRNKKTDAEKNKEKYKEKDKEKEGNTAQGRSTTKQESFFEELQRTINERSMGGRLASSGKGKSASLRSRSESTPNTFAPNFARRSTGIKEKDRKNSASQASSPALDFRKLTIGNSTK